MGNTLAACLNIILGNMSVRVFVGRLTALVLLAILFMAAPSFAMTALDDGDLSGEAAGGIALALEQFSLEAAPTSYIELTGQNPNATEAAQGWYRGDARYYGLSFTGTAQSGTSGESGGTDWYGAACSTAFSNLGCSLNTGTINDFASVYNPYILRVFQYTGITSTGTCQGPPCTGVGTGPTVLELAGPTNSDIWRFSFWGELDVGRNETGTGVANDPVITVGTLTGPTNYAVSTAAATGTKSAGCLAAGNGNTAYCGLQNQDIIIGKPIAVVNVTPTSSATLVNMPTDFRVFSLQGGLNNTDPTLGMTYQSALQGNFRFSVAQVASANTNAAEAVPNFDSVEGMYFYNVDAFLPLGRLYYQSITFSDAATCPTTCPAGSAVTLTNNFVVNLNAIPAVAADYNDFYCGGQYAVATLSCTTSNVTIGPSGTGAVTYSEPVYNNPNPYTHGFVDWGCTSATVCPSGNTDYLPSATATDNGIFFHAPQGLNSPAGSATGVTNIGTATISGLLIQQLTIVTKGAN